MDMLTEHDSLLVTLDAEAQPWSKMVGGRRYGLLPGTAVHVPFELVRIYFGDPRSGESAVTAVSPDGQVKIMIRSRADEISRLETLYGVRAEILARQQESRVSGKPFVQPTLAERAPKVSVTSVTGEPVPTVLSDPAGDSPMPITVAADDTDAMNARIAQMQKDLDGLLAQQRAAQAQQPPDGTGAGDEPTEDAPR